MSFIRRIGLACIALLCFGCAATNPHLDDRLAKAMSSGSIAIIYVDPAQPVGVLRYATAGAGGGAAGAIVAEINAAAGANQIEAKLVPYAPLMAKQDPIARNYQVVHEALSSVTWLQHAKWERIQRDTVISSVRQLVKEAGTDVVIFVYPCTVIYANGDPLAVRTEINIYAAHAAGGFEDSHIEYRNVDAVAPLGPDSSDTLPNPNFYNQYLRKGPELDQQLTEVFADDGAEFNRAYSQALSKIKPALWYYFTETKLPASGN